MTPKESFWVNCCRYSPYRENRNSLGIDEFRETMSVSRVKSPMRDHLLNQRGRESADRVIACCALVSRMDILEEKAQLLMRQSAQLSQ
jgi:hypothetical protein